MRTGGRCSEVASSAGRRVVMAGTFAQLPLLLLQLVPLLSVTEAQVLLPGNRHTVASIPGELMIGALVPVHERPSAKQAQSRICGAVREQYGIQRVEVAFRTIDSINADPNILPNITLGVEIRDSCWHSPIALEQSIEFIRDAMAASEQKQVVVSGGGGGLPATMQVDSATAPGNATQCPPHLLRQQSKKVKNIVGVVGPASSTDTVQVQNLLQLFNMPQLGYSATSRDLSNKNFFKYFLRVVPSDKLQAQVMIDLMLAHNWTYITVAYTEGSYGSSLMNAFRERAQEVGICFATLESMPPNADDAKFDELIEAIQKHPNARVVICMCEGRTLGKLFAGFKRKNIINEYLVVGSDGWSDRFDVVEKQEEYALGGISIRIHSAYVDDFDDYYFQLNPFTNHRNPWFAEFWETRFQCNLEALPTATLPPGNGNGNVAAGNRAKQTSVSASLSQQRPFIRPPGAKVYNRTCTGRESLRNNHKQDAKMAFVQKSIITMALGLDSMQRAICPSEKPGLCPEMLPVNGSILLAHLMNVSFSFLDEKVSFDEQGDPPGRYEILNFQRRRPPPQLDLASGASDDDLDADDTAEETGDNTSDLYSGAPDTTSARLPPDEAASDALPRPQTGARAEADQRRRLNPLYDSYSTLRVLRTSATVGHNLTAGSPLTAAVRRRRRGRHAHPARQLHPPASGYSSTSGYEYVHVGSWQSESGLSLFGQIHWPARYRNDAAAGSSVGESAGGAEWQFNLGGGVSTADHRAPHLNNLPKSVCALPCPQGHAKKIQSDSVKCCWVCVLCRPNEYLLNEFKCKACEKGWWPNSARTGCDQIPIRYLDWRSMEALTAISIALFGLTLTLATAFVFIRHNNTPVVKSTTRELSYMILFAMILCYVTTFFLVSKPRTSTCFVTRILPGFAFAMMYGALVTKTNRIARILAGSKKKIITRRLRFMSATSQVAITWIIVLIECIIIVLVLFKEPANSALEYPNDERVLLVCNTTTMGIIAPLGFDFFLIAMCTLYAFKTRNVPENFNEAKFIGFTMYTTLVIWIAFVVIYLSSEHKVTTLCLCISFSALFALFLLFFPRCYIILLKPEKNNRSFFTTTKNVRCHIGYQIGSAGAAAAAAAAATANQQPPANQLAALFAAGNHSLDELSAEAGELAARENRLSRGARTSGLHWEASLSCSGSGYHEASAVRHDSPKLVGAPGYWPANPDASKVGVSGGRARTLRSLWGGLVSMFSRRSRRKQFDKTLSIQQHLRAIRHAENLDRKTHFRRSQVQRLMQRFDFSLTTNEPLPDNGPSQAGEPANKWSATTNLRQVVDATCADPTMAVDHLKQLQLLVKSDDGAKLLLAIGQLLGSHTVWRLAEALRRYCSASITSNPRQASTLELPFKSCSPTLCPNSSKSIAASLSPSPSSVTATPLDLDKQTDRALGLMMLRYLAAALRRAQSELEGSAGGSRALAGASLQRPKTTSVSSSLAVLDPAQLGFIGSGEQTSSFGETVCERLALEEAAAQLTALPLPSPPQPPPPTDQTNATTDTIVVCKLPTTTTSRQSSNHHHQRQQQPRGSESLNKQPLSSSSRLDGASRTSLQRQQRQQQQSSMTPMTFNDDYDSSYSSRGYLKAIAGSGRETSATEAVVAQQGSQRANNLSELRDNQPAQPNNPGGNHIAATAGQNVIVLAASAGKVASTKKRPPLHHMATTDCNEEDPIKRALDRIMGSKSSAGGSLAKLSSPSVQQQQQEQEQQQEQQHRCIDASATNEPRQRPPANAQLVGARCLRHHHQHPVCAQCNNTTTTTSTSTSNNNSENITRSLIGRQAEFKPTATANVTTAEAKVEEAAAGEVSATAQAATDTDETAATKNKPAPLAATQPLRRQPALMYLPSQPRANESNGATAEDGSPLKGHQPTSTTELTCDDQSATCQSSSFPSSEERRQHRHQRHHRQHLHSSSHHHHHHNNNHYQQQQQHLQQPIVGHQEAPNNQSTSRRSLTSSDLASNSTTTLFSLTPHRRQPTLNSSTPIVDTDHRLVNSATNATTNNHRRQHRHYCRRSRLNSPQDNSISTSRASTEAGEPGVGATASSSSNSNPLTYCRYCCSGTGGGSRECCVIGKSTSRFHHRHKSTTTPRHRSRSSGTRSAEHHKSSENVSNSMRHLQDSPPPTLADCSCCPSQAGSPKRDWDAEEKL